MSAIRFYDQAVLLERLTHAVRDQQKRVVFLVGAPLAAAEIKGRPGVPGVADIVELIRNEFAKQPEALGVLDQEIRTAGPGAYQKAFEYLIGARGQDVANKIVKRAVLMARASPRDALELLDDAMEELERDADGWVLPAGVRTLGKL